MTAPEKRIDLIDRSLSCFFVGWCSLVPLAGPFLLVVVIRDFLHVRRNAEDDWNPARKYLSWGLFLATVGCLETLLIVGLALGFFFLRNQAGSAD